MAINSIYKYSSVINNSTIKNNSAKQGILCNKTANSKYEEKSLEHQQKISNMRQMVKDSEKNSKKSSNSIVESTLSYGASVRESRKSSSNTANALKQLKYNFKNISSQIRKSKTSVNAKQVASKARREVILLKSKLQSGKYDKEELEAAIAHAKSMERAAKKKARHLEEEELIKVTDKEGYDVSAAEFESRLEEKLEEQYDSEMQDSEEEMEELTQEQIAQAEEAIYESIEEVRTMMEESMDESMEEVSEDMYDLLADSMEEMMEETLGRLFDGIMIVTDFEMNEDEFKEYKLKHRLSEDKTMLEADSKYLKAIFDIYDKKMGSESSGINISQVSSPVINSAYSSVDIPNIVDASV